MFVLALRGGRCAMTSGQRRPLATQRLDAASLAAVRVPAGTGKITASRGHTPRRPHDSALLASRPAASTRRTRCDSLQSSRAAREQARVRRGNWARVGQRIELGNCPGRAGGSLGAGQCGSGQSAVGGWWAAGGRKCSAQCAREADSVCARRCSRPMGRAEGATTPPPQTSRRAKEQRRALNF